MSPHHQHAKKSPPENLLFRSHIEICRILRVLMKERSPLKTEVGRGHLFKSRVLAVDESNNRFAIAYCQNKSTNSELLQAPVVGFTASSQHGAHFSFEAAAPKANQLGGDPVIQLDLPQTLLLHNRREHPHLPVQGPVSLRCVSNAFGEQPFEGKITDVSHDGLGCLLYDFRIDLEIGSVLKGNRIVLPDGSSVLADLELRHISNVVLDDGSVAHRAGFRFAKKREALEKLGPLFIQDLGKN